MLLYYIVFSPSAPGSAMGSLVLPAGSAVLPGGAVTT